MLIDLIYVLQKLAEVPLEKFVALLSSKPIHIPVVKFSIDPINQRSLFRSEVPVLPNIFLP